MVVLLMGVGVFGSDADQGDKDVEGKVYILRWVLARAILDYMETLEVVRRSDVSREMKERAAEGIILCYQLLEILGVKVSEGGKGTSAGVAHRPSGR